MRQLKEVREIVVSLENARARAYVLAKPGNELKHGKPHLCSVANNSFIRIDYGIFCMHLLHIGTDKFRLICHKENHAL